MKDSEVLKKARKAIASRRQKYVCYAIRDCKGVSYNQQFQLRIWINRMLNRYGSYESWLDNTATSGKRPRNPGEFREARLQWLDWMIDYCEKEEAK